MRDTRAPAERTRRAAVASAALRAVAVAEGLDDHQPWIDAAAQRISVYVRTW